MEREEVKQRVLAIARDVYALSASSYGPTGRVKALLPNEDTPDAMELTSSAERICDRIGSAESPIANVYLHILKSRLRNHCDGGLFTMILSSKLLLMAVDGELSSTPQYLVAQGYALAVEWCLSYLEDSSCPVRVPIDWSDTVALFAVMRGIIGSKPISSASTPSHQTVATLLPVLVETFTSVLPFVTENPGESLPIRFVQDAAFASSVATSRLYKNSVLLDYEHHASLANQQLLLHDVKVLLFSTSVDPSNPNNDEAENGVLIESSCDTDDDTICQELCSAIAKLGVGVVISQKLLSKELQFVLARKGIMSIHRLGITHMRAVQLLTGAAAIGDWRVVLGGLCSDHSLGFLSSVAYEKVNHKTMLLLENKGVRSLSSPGLGVRAWPVATVVLSVAHEYAYKELVHEIKSCFKRLVAMMEESQALAGAGCTEIHMAAWLRRNSQHLVSANPSRPQSETERVEAAMLRRLRMVINGFAAALESIAVALDHGVHGMVDEVREQLAKVNQATLNELPDTEIYVLYGWDPVEGRGVPVVTVQQQEDTSSSDSSSDSEDAETVERCVLSALVLDSLQTKRDALVSAVDCATTLLSVAGVIHTTAGA